LKYTFHRKVLKMELDAVLEEREQSGTGRAVSRGAYIHGSGRDAPHALSDSRENSKDDVDRESELHGLYVHLPRRDPALDLHPPA
jgi:hypothetical protein